MKDIFLTLDTCPESPDSISESDSPPPLWSLSILMEYEGKDDGSLLTQVCFWQNPGIFVLPVPK